MCMFSGTPYTWECREYTHGNMYGSLSVNGDEFPAVVVPFFWKTGGSFFNAFKSMFFLMSSFETIILLYLIGKISREKNEFFSAEIALM